MKDIDNLINEHLHEDQAFDLFVRLHNGGPLTEAHSDDEKHALRMVFTGLKEENPYKIAKGAYLMCGGDDRLTKNYIRYLHQVTQMDYDNATDGLAMYDDPMYTQSQIYAIWDAFKYIHAVKRDVAKSGEQPLKYKPKRLDKMGPWLYKSNKRPASIHMPRKPGKFI